MVLVFITRGITAKVVRGVCGGYYGVIDGVTRGARRVLPGDTIMR